MIPVLEEESEIKKQSSEAESPEIEDSISSKFMRDPSCILQTLQNGNYLIKVGSSDIYKISEITGTDDINETVITTKFEKTTETITLKNIHQFTVYRNITIIVVNYLNRAFQIVFPVMINSTIEQVKVDFCKTYFCQEGTMAVVLKNKRLPKKDLEKLIIAKDFDFQKDQLVFIQGQANPSKMWFVINSNYIYMSAQKHKYIMLVDSTISVSSIYLFRGYPLKVNSLDIIEIDENPSKYIKNTKEPELVDQYDFKQLFSKEKFDSSTLVHSNKDIEVQRDYNRVPYDENEPFAYSVKSVEVSPEVKLKPSKIYLIKLDIDNAPGVEPSKIDNNKKMFTNEKTSVKFYFFLDSGCGQYLYIGGLGYVTLSDFDLPDKK